MIKLFSALFLVCCGAGLVYQVVDISELYFEFRVLSVILIEIPKTILTPDLSACFRYSDIVDLKLLNAEKDISLEKSFTAEFISTVQRMVTAKDIFTYTPEVTAELFRNCLTRPVEDYNFQNNSAKRCFELFKVTKFVFQEFVCYTFHTTEPFEYSYRNLAYAVYKPGTIYAIELNEGLFRTAEGMKAVVHSHSGGRPFKSSALSRAFDRHCNLTTGKSKFNFIRMSYSMVQIQLLPRPYSTKCLGRSPSRCVLECLRNFTLGTYGKLPFSTIIELPEDVRIINRLDLANKTLQSDLNRAEYECIVSCSDPGCKEDYTLTTISYDEARASDPQWLTFEVSIPRWPSFSVTTYKRMTFNDYFVYVLSCVGTWFASSVFSLDPFDWLRARKVQKGSNTGEFCMESRRMLARELKDEHGFIFECSGSYL